MKLLTDNGEFYRGFKISYREGERYPHLVRDSKLPDLLSDILRPHASGAREKP